MKVKYRNNPEIAKETCGEGEPVASLTRASWSIRAKTL
jgi:hypothetical protein